MAQSTEGIRAMEENFKVFLPCKYTGVGVSYQDIQRAPEINSFHVYIGEIPSQSFCNATFLP